MATREASLSDKRSVTAPVVALAAAIVVVLGLGSPAIAHETQTYPSAVCQSGELCLWPDYGRYLEYWSNFEGCVHSCHDATYSGSDGNFTGYYPWPTGNTMVLNNSVDIAKNNGTCGVYVYTGTSGSGTVQYIASLTTKNPVAHPNDMSSNHWCNPWS